jgi:hypothetical protein
LSVTLTSASFRTLLNHFQQPKNVHHFKIWR